MKTQNAVQIFTSASNGLGYNSAHEMAKQIKRHTNSKFFPLANVGPYADTINQDIAAEKEQLIPLYARTLFVGEGDVSIVILAKNDAARTWLNSQPSRYEKEKTLNDNLLLTHTGDVTLFVSNSWFESKKMATYAHTLRGRYDTVLLWDARHFVSQPSALLDSWCVIPHLPINYVEEADAQSFSLLQNAAKQRRVRKQNVQIGGCFYPEGEFEKRFGETIQELPPSERSLESIFMECKTTPTNLHHGGALPGWMTDSASMEMLKTVVEHALQDFIQRNTLTKEQIETYRARLCSEIILIDNNGMAAHILRAISVHKARGDGSLFLGRTQINCFVFHLLGMTTVDPVENQLSEHMYFSSIGDIRDLRFDFEVSAKGRCNIDKKMMEDYSGCYYGALHVDKMLEKTALREIARSNQIRCNKWLAKKLMDYGNSFPFEDVTGELETFLKRAPDIAQLFSQEPGVARMFEALLGKNINVTTSLAARVMLVDSSFLVAPAIKANDESIKRHSIEGLDVLGMTSKELSCLPAFKFNFMGLRSLSWIEAAINNPYIDIASIDDIPLKDEAVFDSMSVNRFGIFPFDRSVFDYCFKKGNIKSIDDLAVAFALRHKGKDDKEHFRAFVTREANVLPATLADNDELKSIVDQARGLLVFKEQIFDVLTKVGELSTERAFYWLSHSKELKTSLGIGELTLDLNKAGKSECESNAIVELVTNSIHDAHSKGHATHYAVLAYKAAWLRHHYLNKWFHVVVNDSLMRKRSNLEILKALVELGAEIYGVEQENALCIKRFIVTNEGWFPVLTNRTKLKLYNIKKWDR